MSFYIHFVLRQHSERITTLIYRRNIHNIHTYIYERNAARGIRLADCGARKGLGVFFSGAAAAAMLDVRGSSERVDRPTHCSSQSWSAARLILFNEARLHSAVSCSCFIIINDSASRWSPVRACRFFSTLSYSNIYLLLRICKVILPHTAPHIPFNIKLRTWRGENTF